MDTRDKSFLFVVTTKNLPSQIFVATPPRGPAIAGHRCAFHQYEKTCLKAGNFSSGGPDRIRTGDLLIANEALYQLSYGPALTTLLSFVNKCHCNSQAAAYTHGSGRCAHAALQGGARGVAGPFIDSCRVLGSDNGRPCTAAHPGHLLSCVCIRDPAAMPRLERCYTAAHLTGRLFLLSFFGYDFGTQP